MMRESRQVEGSGDRESTTGGRQNLLPGTQRLTREPRHRTSHSHTRLMVLLATWALLLSTCWNPFAPIEGELGGIERLTLTEQRSPEDVLQNFRYAYIYRDSLVYSDLLDTGFVFLYYDPEAGGTGAYNYWGRDTELRTTGRMFRSFDNFTLVWNATIFQDPGVISDSIFEASITKTFDLAVMKQGSTTNLTGNAVFSFVKDSSGVWRISRWQDESFI